MEFLGNFVLTRLFLPLCPYAAPEIELGGCLFDIPVQLLPKELAALTAAMTVKNGEIKDLGITKRTRGACAHAG